MGRVNLDSLSRELHYEIFSHLDRVHDLRHVKMTCKALFDRVCHDKQFHMNLLRKNWKFVLLASKELQNDPEIQGIVTRKTSGQRVAQQTFFKLFKSFTSDEYFSPEFHYFGDPDLAYAWIAKQGFPMDLLNYPHIKDTSLSTQFSKRMQTYVNDRGFALAAVRANGSDLQHVRGKSPKWRYYLAKLRIVAYPLQNDPVIAESALLSRPFSFRYASWNLRLNPRFQKTALAACGTLIRVMPWYQNDKKMVTIAVGQDGYALQWVSRKLQDDEDVVEVAVTKSGRALKYASKRLRGDKKIVALAYMEDPESFEHADPLLKKDRAFVLTLARHNFWIWRHMDKAFLKDVDIAAAILEQTGNLLHMFSYEIRSNPRLVKLAVTQSPHSYRYAEGAALNDLEIARIAIKGGGEKMAKHASKSVQLLLHCSKGIKQTGLMGKPGFLSQKILKR